MLRIPRRKIVKIPSFACLTFTGKITEFDAKGKINVSVRILIKVLFGLHLTFSENIIIRERERERKKKGERELSRLYKPNVLEEQT